MIMMIIFQFLSFFPWRLSISYQVDLFKAHSNHYPKTNPIISPLGIYRLLTVFANGTKDKCQYEILRTLDNYNIIHLNTWLSHQTVHLAYFPEIKLVNGIFPQNAPKDSFVQLSNKYDVFTSKAINSTNINSWLLNKTDNEIEGWVNDTHIHGQTFLINALKFKNHYNVSLPNYYYKNPKVEVVRIPSTYKFISSFFIMPKIDMNEFVEKMTTEEFRQYLNISEADGVRVNVDIQMFKVSSYKSINSELQDIGIEKIFKDDDCDFENMFGETTHVNVGEVIEDIVLNYSEPYPEVLMSGLPVIDIRPPYILVVKHSEIWHALAIAKVEQLRNYKYE